MPQNATRERERGRYQFKSRLGVGSSATVWLARERLSGDKVCVKRLHPHLVEDETARARLESEVLAARIDHPSVVPLREARLSGPEPALVFPFVEGETLAARLAREGPIEPHAAAEIAQQVADALAAAHRAGIVHRDVKPSNILLGADRRARLLDFGVAHALEAAGRELTGPGMTVGTLPYMAPEQLAGHPPEPANDVFALGAVLYEMLTGRPPFEAETPIMLAQAHERGPARPDQLPALLDDVVLSALSHDPDARPTANDLVGALQAWRLGQLGSDEPTRAIVPMTRPRRLRLPRRGSVAVAGLVGVLVLAVVSASAFAPDWSDGTADGAQVLAPDQTFGPNVGESVVEAKELVPAAARNSEPVEPTRIEPARGDKPAATDKKSGKEKGKAKGKGKGKGKGNR